MASNDKDGFPGTENCHYPTGRGSRLKSGNSRVVGLRDNHAGTSRRCREHSLADRLGIFQGHAADGRAAAAEEAAERAGAFARGDDGGEEGDQLPLAVGLVQVILEGAAEQLVVSRQAKAAVMRQALAQERTAARRASCLGQDPAGGGRGDLEVGDEQDETAAPARLRSAAPRVRRRP